MKSGRLIKERLLYVLLFVVRLAIGGMFLWSGLIKIRQPYDFLSSIYNYELVGPKLGMMTAIVLPWLEVLVGICLIGGIFVSGALLLSAGMGAMFTFTLFSALCRDLDISCGCFGANGGTITYFTLFRAFMILLLSMGAYIGFTVVRSKVTELYTNPSIVLQS